MLIPDLLETGINVTNAVFCGSPPPLGYGFSPYVTSSLYAIPIVAVILGEVAGRFINDGVSDLSASSALSYLMNLTDCL